jgi:hypothetical protein
MAMTRGFRSWTIVLVTSALAAACGSSSSDFETFMRRPLPPGVEVLKMDGNWGNDPWRCWQLSPVNDTLKDDLIATWHLVPDANAFNGVASGGQIYCRYGELSESYSGTSDSYRAVGVDVQRKIMIVYFYNG